MLAYTPAAVVVRLDDLGVVSTTIDGKGPYHFVLDTGGGVQVRTLVLPSVAVGRAEVHNVAAAIIPLPGRSTDTGSARRRFRDLHDRQQWGS